MADIKVDKFEYEMFLNRVSHIIDAIDGKDLPAGLQAEKEIVVAFINKELEIINLMEQRKLFYNFYTENKYKNPKSANEMKAKYIETNEKIKELRKD